MDGMFHLFAPTPRGIFDTHTLYNISLSCDILTDPILYRAIFLTAFYGFLRMSNITPHSLRKFSQEYHFLRQDLIFAPPGAHLPIKWTKTLQHHKSHHWIQLPSIQNHFLFPVRPFRVLIDSRPLPPSAPLFANNFHTLRSSAHTFGMPPSAPLFANNFHTLRSSAHTFGMP